MPLTRQEPERADLEVIWNGAADWYQTGEKGALLPHGDALNRQEDQVLGSGRHRSGDQQCRKC